MIDTSTYVTKSFANTPTLRGDGFGADPANDNLFGGFTNRKHTDASNSLSIITEALNTKLISGTFANVPNIESDGFGADPANDNLFGGFTNRKHTDTAFTVSRLPKPINLPTDCGSAGGVNMRWG